MRNLFLLLSFFLLSLPARACEIFERAILTPDFIAVSVDESAKSRWLQAQKGNDELYRWAKVLSDNIRVVGRSEFEEALKTAVGNVLQKVPENSEILLAQPSSFSSEKWTSRYAQALVPALRGKKLVEPSRLLNEAKQILEQGKELHVMGMDDAVYSGSQLESHVSEFISRLGPLMMDPRYQSKVKLHIVRAIGNSAATKKYTSYMDQMSEKVKQAVSFEVGLKVRTLDEILADNNLVRDDKNPGQAFFGLYSHIRSLVIPFHKKPDGISFPAALMIGKLPDTDQTIPFIKGPQTGKGEPYRRPAYLHLYWEKTE